MEITRVAVMGLGTMGAGIAEVFAKHGCTVIGVDRDEPSIERGRTIITTSMGRAIDRGKLSQGDADAALARITFTTDRSATSDVDLVVEAIPEVLEWKRELLQALDSLLPSRAIIASNTSSLSITTLATFTSHPVLGLHFFNPAPVQPLVEIITHPGIDDSLVRAMQELMSAIGKKPVTVADRPGFLVNALLVPYLNHAAALLGEGDASPAELDAAMTQLGLAPMGPAALMDLVGLDVHVEVCKVLHNAFGTEELAPASSIQSLVSSGFLGRKTKRGYYDYSAPVATAEPSARALQYARWLNARHLNEAARMMESGYANADAIDLGMMAGCGYKRGPITAIAEYGVENVLVDLADAYASSRSTMDQPCQVLVDAAGGATLRR